MFAISRVSISPHFLASQNAVFKKSFSSKKPSLAVKGDGSKQSSIISHLNDTRGLLSKDALSIPEKSSSAFNGDDPELSFTISYLIKTCGLSSKDAHSISQKITIKSPENPDSVLKLLRRYGFTDANIHILITRLPRVLLSSPEKILLPKLEFFRSIGVPPAVLGKNLSYYPQILHHSLENHLLPFYNFLKDLLKSDERVAHVFKRNPRVFEHGLREELPSNIAILRQRGIPESFIVRLMLNQPLVLVINTKKFTSYVDRAADMGLDRSKAVFIDAIEVFATMSESILKRKIEVYRSCGWSESDISLALSRSPRCLALSEKNIMDSMNFLVNALGLQPDAVARCPILLGFNLDKRMKPRYIVARVLKEKGLFKKNLSACYFYKMSEAEFLKRYIVKYEEHIPELLDIYRGKSVSEMEFSQQVILK